MKIQLSENALKVLESRYLKRNADRRIIETPEEMFERVALAVAHGELLLEGPHEASRWQEVFLEMMSSLEFLPNSPTLMNGGTPLGQLSACFVLPVEDTTEGIFEALKQMAMVQRTGGGTGFSFTRLRPENDLVASTGGEASGPVSFMRVFDCATEHIKQGGRRRGANMGVMRVDHPDIMEFIRVKTDETLLQNFNLSVSVPDSFMEAALGDKDYDLIHPRTGERAGRLRAKAVLEAITESAWFGGDPGLIFFDPINRANPTPQLGPIEATNPCGEIPLLPYESCNLGSINLSRMVDDRPARKELRWGRLRQTTRNAVRFLDDVIEANRYPIPEIEYITKGNRKIGLGVMGFSEMLIKLGISYDSQEAVSLAERLMETISREARNASQELARTRGVFPNWRGSIHQLRRLRVRNATCTTVAPTGTIGIIAGTTSGIEPLFALAYRRSHVLGGQTLLEKNPIFEKYLSGMNLDSNRILEEIAEKGTIGAVGEAPETLKRLFVTALEISAERHLEIQAAFQRHVDNSVSKTINMPEDSSAADIWEAYARAWKLGLKGVTIYRYGSRSAQIMELGTREEEYHYEHGSRCDPQECKV